MSSVNAWVDGALKEAVNKDMKVINLLDVLKDTIKTEEAMPGMQNEEDITTDIPILLTATYRIEPWKTGLGLAVGIPIPGKRRS